MVMTALHDRLAAIAAAPAGPAVAAYFDYDGTVIDGYSVTAFYRHRLRHLEMGIGEMARTVAAGLRGIRTEAEFAELVALSLSAWKGRPATELDALGEKLFQEEIAGRMHGEIWDLVQAHRERRHRVVLASSATRFQVEPMARELGADEVLCTELEIHDGVLTGRTAGHPPWGSGKAIAVLDHAGRRGIDLAASFAYSNGDEDQQFLEAVGNPVAVSPTDRLRACATERGWPVLDCAARPGMVPSPSDIVRTLGFYSGVLGGVGTAIGVGLVNRSRRQVLDLAFGVGADIGLGFAGIGVDAHGVQNLWAARPCVFVFNHQSQFDIPILMKLLRSGFTGVAKKEAANVPLWGQLFRVAEVAFVDRGNPSQTRAALAPAVNRLREDGISLAIAPEGTRSATPRLGPFKKGAFHIAMQAQVPMVPIVIRNAGEVMVRGAQTLRSGTVDVCVLPPVDTSAWTTETIDTHVADVRGMFQRTLTHWPRRAAS